MSSEAAHIPYFDFSGQVLDVDDEQRGGDDERWKDMCSKVRDALETQGCFLLFYDKIPQRQREDMFMEMNVLFDLPEETKNKYISPTPYGSYLVKSTIIPLHQSFGIDDEPELDTAQAFTNLMWPEGNPSFW